MAPGSSGDPGVIEGVVKGVQTRSETSPSSNIEIVCTFRIERHDEAGNRVMLVPVELRGLTLEGSVNEGDWVRAYGKPRSGTFIASKVENATTGARVQPREQNRIAVVLFSVVFVAIVGFIGWIAYTGFTQDTGPPEAPVPRVVPAGEATP